MDAELTYLFAKQAERRIPVARVALTESQLITNSQTNIGIAEIAANQNDDTVTLTTEGSHGLLPGEVVIIENNLSQVQLTAISGDGTNATVACTLPHALLDQQTVTIQNNLVSVTNSSAVIEGDGSTATVTTVDPHGFANGDTATIVYDIANQGAVPSADISLGVLSATGTGATATITTTTPHTFVNGQSVTVLTDTGSISQIFINTPSSGVSTVYASSVPVTVETVTLSGVSYEIALVSPALYANVITTAASSGSTTGSVVTNVSSIPAEITTGATITISGVIVDGALSSIVGNAGGANTFQATMTKDHTLSVGSMFTIGGITGTNSFFNGTYTVASVISPTTVQVTSTFNSTASFSTSASWAGTSGFNKSWTVTGTSTITISGHTHYIIEFGVTSGPYATTGNTPLFAGGGQLLCASSNYNGSHVATPISATSFTIPYSSNYDGSGGTWTGSGGFDGTYTITSIIDGLNFTFASGYIGSSSSGTVYGPCGLNASNVTVAVSDINSFTYTTTVDTAGSAVPGFNFSGESGFNGVQTPIAYIDGMTFSFASSVQATVQGGNLTATLSGFNNTEATVLAVPSSTTFTYANQLAGASSPYVYGMTYGSGSVITYDTSYTGITTLPLTWSQPATFCANGMVASGNGITVPQNGWYKIISRVELSSSPTATYGDIVAGSYAFIDIYVNNVLQSRGTQINQQGTTLEFSTIVSDLVFIEANQTVSLVATAFSPLNAGQIYAWGYSAAYLPNLSYLAVVYSSP